MKKKRKKKTLKDGREQRRKEREDEEKKPSGAITLNLEAKEEAIKEIRREECVCV